MNDNTVVWLSSNNVFDDRSNSHQPHQNTMINRKPWIEFLARQISLLLCQKHSHPEDKGSIKYTTVIQTYCTSAINRQMIMYLSIMYYVFKHSATE